MLKISLRSYGATGESGDTGSAETVATAMAARAIIVLDIVVID